MFNNKINLFIVSELKKLQGSDFVKNVFLLMSGNGLAQLVLLLTIPLITRLYTPENFGLLALFTAGVNILSMVGSLCYERAIVLPEEVKEALSVAILSFCILFAIYFLIFIVALFADSDIGILLNNKEFGFWIKLVPFCILLVGMVNILNYWLIRNKKFKKISFSHVGNAATSSGLKILVGFFVGACSWGLVGGFIGGWVVSLIIVLSNIEVNKEQNFKRISTSEIFAVAKKYKQFPIFASTNALINISSQYMVVFLFSAFFNPIIVGFYSLVDKVLRQPIFLASQSVTNVFFQKASEIVIKKEPLMPALGKTALGLIIIGIFPFGILTIFSKDLFYLVFGSDWVPAGIYVQILTPWYFLMFINGGANVIYEVSQNQHIKLKINIWYSIFRFSVLIGGCVLLKKVEVILIYFVLINVLFEFLLALGAFNIARKIDLGNTK